MRPDFVVGISHDGHPLQGVAVKVITGAVDAAPVFAANTDQNGFVEIQGLAAGKYYLVADYRGIEAGREWIEVNPVAKKAKKRFNFQGAPFSDPVKKITGRLTGLEKGNTGNPIQDLIHRREVPEAGVGVALQDAFSEASGVSH